MNKEKQQFALIRWVDACLHGQDIVSRDDPLGLIEVVSVGIIVAEDAEKIVLALDWFIEPDTFRSVAAIPKANIKQVVRCPTLEKIPQGKEAGT